MPKIYLMPVQEWIKRRYMALNKAIYKTQMRSLPVPKEWTAERSMIEEEMKKYDVKF